MEIAQQDSILGISLGEVLRIPCKFIKGKSDAQPIVLNTIAQELKARSKNITPVIIRLIAEDKYEAVLNTQILDAARQAKMDFVWCIVVDDQMEEQVQVETGSVVKVNVQTASEDELLNVLEYIRASKKGFNKIEPHKIAQAIVGYREGNKVTSLSFLTKLKCGIGKTKLKPLSENLVVA